MEELSRGGDEEGNRVGDQVWAEVRVTEGGECEWKSVAISLKLAGDLGWGGSQESMGEILTEII